MKISEIRKSLLFLLGSPPGAVTTPSTTKSASNGLIYGQRAQIFVGMNAIRCTGVCRHQMEGRNRAQHTHYSLSPEVALRVDV